MVLAVISIFVDLPNIANTNMDTNTNDGFPILIITCASSHSALLALLFLYDLVLVILINGFAIFTLQFPKNLKEARNIAFATLAIGLVWKCTVMIYFKSVFELIATEHIIILIYDT